MRRLLWRFLRSILFRVDAETAHGITFALVKAASVTGGLPLRLLSGASRALTKESATQVAGLVFSSPVGLAAGFDKNADIIVSLPHLGFAFAEIGTVTPRPQPGNPRPRLFRDPSRQAVFNRMGFNNLGASVVSERLLMAKPRLPRGFRVGVNLGKNKDTPLAEAAADYLAAAEPFRGLADYLVINVSSPNTPGLRSLQSLEALKPISSVVLEEAAKWSPTPPVFLKLAPELKGEDLRNLLEEAARWGVSGFVLTNTLAGTLESAGKEPGGWSGGPLASDALDRLRDARGATRLPIISVGGIMEPRDAVERLEAGADLVQLYTGWIYGGPSFPASVLRQLSAYKKQKPQALA